MTMDKETATISLVIITVAAIFAVVYPIVPANVEPFSELGILGPSMSIGAYPQNVTAGEQFHLYGYIGNHEGSVSYYQFETKLGNQSTVVSNSTASDAPVIFTHLLVLENNQTAIFPVTLSINSTGTDERLIFELWSFDTTTSQFAYTGIWDQLFLNVTAPAGGAAGAK
jgi:uncharacterized membrane protein